MRTLAVVALLAGLTAACGDHVQEEMATTAVQEAMRPEPVDTVTAAWLAHELVEARLTEWGIELEPAQMPAGQITFRVLNQGQVEHDFEIEGVNGTDGEWDVEGDVPPNEVRTLNVTLEPGTYEVYCTRETEHGEHDELGMRTTFTVR